MTALVTITKVVLSVTARSSQKVPPQACNRNGNPKWQRLRPRLFSLEYLVLKGLHQPTTNNQQPTTTNNNQQQPTTNNQHFFHAPFCSKVSAGLSSLIGIKAWPLCRGLETRAARAALCQLESAILHTCLCCNLQWKQSPILPTGIGIGRLQNCWLLGIRVA